MASVTLDPTESLLVSDALTRHYRLHGLPLDGGADADWFRVRIGPIVLPLPNPPARKRAVFFHDVNHVATGYDTVFSHGEMLIAAYEIGSGCGPYAIAWLINAGVFGLGLLVRPRSLFRAFVRGRHAKSVYAGHDRKALEAMTVAQLRTSLDIPTEIPAPDVEDRAAFAAWSIASLGIVVGPVLLLIGALRLA